VDPQLELRELRLAEDGALDVLEVVAEQREPRVVVLDRLQHVLDQQRLVERGGDLGDKRRVVGQVERLRLVRQVALHRVPELVRHRADVGVLAVVVDQHVGMDVVGAAVRVGAGALPFVRQQVDPSLAERALDRSRVVGPSGATAASTSACASSGV
jgi:hypothetical protein